MARFSPTTLTSTYSAVDALNANFADIATLMEQVVFRDGTVDNSMLADLDVNHFKVQNVADATANTDAVNLGQIGEQIASIISQVQDIAVLPNSSIPVASRTLLSALSSTTFPAVLTESGREGIFVFSSDDLSASVTLDTEQAILVAPATDPTGASGAWVRKFDGTPQAKWFGVKGDGSTEDRTATETASAISSAMGLGALNFFGDLTINSVLTLDDDDLNIDGRGSKITNTNNPGANTWLSITGDDLTFEGQHIINSLGNTSIAYINVSAANLNFINGCTIEDAAGTLGGPQMFVREGSTGFVFADSKMIGHKAAIDCRASDATFSNSKFNNTGSVGGDDCIAIKAIGVAVDNPRITNCYFENYTDFLGIGTQIGTSGVDDTTYAGHTRGGIVTSCTGRNCSNIINIKPGTSATADYRYGLVEGYRFDNLVLYDDTGSKMSGAISITGGRASVTRDIKATNIETHGRCASGANGALFTIWCRNFGAAASFSNISLSGSSFDPYLGVANGVNSAPGDPYKNIILIQNDNSGTFSEISFPDVVANGCSGSGVTVPAGMDDAVSFGRLRLSNVNTSAGSALGGINTASRIRMTSPDVSLTFPATNTASQSMPYYFPVTGSGDVLCDFLTEEIYMTAQIAAGSTPTFYPWIAKRRCQLIEILMMTTDTVAQDATNNIVLAFTNLDGSGASFGNWSNNTTGATGSRTRTTLSPGVWTSIWHAHSVTSSTDKVEGVFARGGRLKIVKSINGSGEAALNNVRLMIRAAPC